MFLNKLVSNVCKEKTNIFILNKKVKNIKINKNETMKQLEFHNKWKKGERWGHILTQLQHNLPHTSIPQFSLQQNKSAISHHSCLVDFYTYFSNVNHCKIKLITVSYEVNQFINPQHYSLLPYLKYFSFYQYF